MTITINIPANLSPNSLLPFSVLLRKLEPSKSYILDFKNVGHVEPFGMLFLAALIRQFIKDRRTSIGRDCKISVQNFRDKSYASFMGLFKSFGLDYGNEPGEACGSGTYIPLTRLPISRITKDARENFIHQAEAIDREAMKIAGVLTRNDDGPITATLTFAIRELMRNVMEHGNTTHIWYAAQYWPTKNRVEVAVLDEGIGLVPSLKRNKKLDVGDDEQAIRLSLQPGVSGAIQSNRKIDGDWRNSGYGLFMTSSLCKSIGEFLICNYSHALQLIGDTVVSHDCSFDGLAIRMVLDTSKIRKLNESLSEFKKNEKNISIPI